MRCMKLRLRTCQSWPCAGALCVSAARGIAVAAEGRATIPAQQRHKPTPVDDFPMSPQRATKRRPAVVAGVVGENGKVGRAFPRHRAQVLCPGPLCFLSFLLRSLRPSAYFIFYLLFLSVILYKTKRYYSSVLSSLQIMYLSFWRYFGDYAVSRKFCVPYAVVYLMP